VVVHSEGEDKEDDNNKKGKNVKMRSYVLKVRD
jgi:hypothetical protein